ncbi:acyloxyacyl hydrolase [uncultured Tateyamaria sp.]|uniref:acyloxyacyl hydrolase n=1 Tax=uncultured Tateyamaria sp. TaxID=455651 RepID=UPI002616EF02|nr:acyloxyacyl hydrolase [uncultured Tateyamaria sp.]
MNRIYVAIISLLLSITAASAQELTFALGTSDFGEGGRDGAAFDLEYRHTPFVQKRILSVAWGASLSLTGEGDAFIGGGVWSRWQWNSGWFIDNSIMPGLYEEGAFQNFLGSTFQIRSLLGVGYQFENGHAISAVISHKSNADLADVNPGMNAYSIRYHFKF